MKAAEILHTGKSMGVMDWIGALEECGRWPVGASSALKRMGFFDAPASCRRHLAVEGGLAIHSANVATMLADITRGMRLEWQMPESPILVGMLHDVCKCDEYVSDLRGGWTHNPDASPMGHGEKSVIIIARDLGIRLTDEEAMCIRWHMGAFDCERNWPMYTAAIHRWPNVLWTHTADMEAAHIVEENR